MSQTPPERTQDAWIIFLRTHTQRRTRSARRARGLSLFLSFSLSLSLSLRIIHGRFHRRDYMHRLINASNLRSLPNHRDRVQIGPGQACWTTRIISSDSQRREATLLRGILYLLGNVDTYEQLLIHNDRPYHDCHRHCRR